jgi:uncharacterized protein (DUF2141 family)
MKTPSTLFVLTIGVALAGALGSARAQTAPSNGCTAVEVHNVRPLQGQLMVAAYGSAEAFGKKPLVSVRVPAGDVVTTLQLCGLAGDAVALMLFQDLDSDGKMNRNLLGMPTEPWGSSGTPGTFGPTWEQARVALDGKALVVRMSQ